MDDRGRSPLRLLAPIALVAFGFALIVVVTSADVDGGGPSPSAQRAEREDLGSTGTDTTETEAEAAGDGEDGEGRVPDEVYVVKSGDTLAAISQKVGVSVERLQELNPDLDPQALATGQEIKLRE